MKDYKKHKFKFNPYLEKLYQSDKPLIIYKVDGGYNILIDFSKKIILNKNNIQNFLNQLKTKNINEKLTYTWVFLDMCTL